MRSEGVAARRCSAAVRGVALSALLIRCAAACAATDGQPPRFQVQAPEDSEPLTFVTYGDTRFTERPGVANPQARRALVQRIAAERPLAILLGGDLVYEGSEHEDYAVYKAETQAWSEQQLRVFPALGN